MRDPLRAKLNLLVAAFLAFALGLSLASALDLTPLTVAAGSQRGPNLILGAPGLENGDLGDGFADVVERIAPAVTTIYVEREIDVAAQMPRRLPSPFDEFFRDRNPQQPDEPLIRPGSGSGFIVSADGYVVTNNHVVENAVRVDVELADRRRFDDVQVIGRDPQTDVALLKIDADDLSPAPLGLSDSTRVGEWVLAIGSPGFSGVGRGNLPTTVTAGIVSAKGRSIGILGNRSQLAIEDFIQTDAAINPGNSGGPLINVRGEVVGVNTAIASETGFYQGYGFAVPIELVREVVDDLIEFGEVRRALIGVRVGPVNEYDARYYGLDRVAGAKVADVGLADERRSPAAAAGIEPGDIIVAVAGEPVESVGDLQRRVRAFDPGDEVTLDVVKRSTREREQVRVTLTGAEAAVPTERNRTAEAERMDALGIDVGSSRPEACRQVERPAGVDGVWIRSVTPRGPVARTLGNARCLIIQDVNGQTVSNVAEYERAIADLGPGDVANLLLYNPQSGTNLVVTVPIPNSR
jgi:serine protease Do